LARKHFESEEHAAALTDYTTPSTNNSPPGDEMEWNSSGDNVGEPTDSRKRGRAGEESKKKTCRCGKERTTLDMFVDSTYYKPVLLNRIDYNMPRECAVCKIEFVQ
jgi:hypothetical protein